MKPYDIIIAGGGIVGLATALQLLTANPRLRIILLEKENGVARHQTGNNSGVIHSGIYYKPGSLKAQNCRTGYNYLLRFCAEHGIQHEICGKVIVATSEAEVPYLNELFARGEANGLTGMRKLDSAGVKEIEPHVTSVAGIFVPQTGIIDYKEVSNKYAELIRSAGGEINLGEAVLGIKQGTEDVTVVSSRAEYHAKMLVNCCGLQSDRVASKTEQQLGLRIIPFRGEYYTIRESKRYLVKNLVYPVPDPNFPFLGVHFTRMIGGEVEAGPNAVLAFKREGYSKWDVNLQDTYETFTWPGFHVVAKKYWRTGLGEFKRSFSKPAFVKALQRLIPEITEDDLAPGGAGIRAQACGIDGKLLDDFSILSANRVINVCNAPSPAATSSLAIGETIAARVREALT